MSPPTDDINRRNGPPGRACYEHAREILDSRDRDGMRVIAADEHTQQEILFYLAATGDADIRAMVARNPSGHFKSDEVLSEDDEPFVRGSLVSKLVQRLATLDPDTAARARVSTQNVLAQLAEDQAVEVRRIVAQEIKACDYIPADIALKLANDIDTGVCSPVLRDSPLLDDEDLIAIIDNHVCKPALTAIARRSTVSENVSDHIAETMDVSAVAALLSNVNAQIREATLDRLIDAAEDQMPWHAPLAMRPGLPDSAVARIASFVADGLLGTMCQRADLSDSAADDLRARVDGRIAEHTRQIREHDAVLNVIEKDMRARRAARRLDADFIAEAAEMENHSVIWVALGLLSDTDREFAYRIFMSGSGKAITALTWLADLPAPLAVVLQSKIGKVPENQCIHPEGGIDYPLSPREMRWQLDLYGYQDIERKSQRPAR